MSIAADCETVRIDSLSIGYPGRDVPHIVAKGILTSLYSGELTCLLGANGAGKSTLLRTLAMSQPAIGGHIYLRGKDMNEYSRSELATLISVVLTDRCEVEGMTVHELVALGRTPYTDFWGKLNDEDEHIVKQSIAQVGIEPLVRRRLNTLSDGERQKVMIAKAIAQETPVVYLDEPTAFLDFPSKVEILQLLRRLSRKTNKSILLSTHDLELALQIADKIWLMQRGEKLITGTPEDLALEGQLTHFFERDGVCFNRQTGLFAIDNPMSSSIHIEGDDKGERFEMVKKALRRIGIDVTAEDTPITVKIAHENFAVYRQNKLVAEETTIEMLLKELKQNM